MSLLNIITAVTAMSGLIGFGFLVGLVKPLIISGRQNGNTWKMVWSGIRNTSVEIGVAVTGIALILLALLSHLV